MKRQTMWIGLNAARMRRLVSFVVGVVLVLVAVVMIFASAEGISGTKISERIRPNPVMATCTQKMMRQLAKVTMMPPKQGPAITLLAQLPYIES